MLKKLGELGFPTNMLLSVWLSLVQTLNFRLSVDHLELNNRDDGILSFFQPHTSVLNVFYVLMASWVLHQLSCVEFHKSSCSRITKKTSFCPQTAASGRGVCLKVSRCVFLLRLNSGTMGKAFQDVSQGFLGEKVPFEVTTKIRLVVSVLVDSNTVLTTYCTVENLPFSTLRILVQFSDYP